MLDLIGVFYWKLRIVWTDCLGPAVRFVIACYVLHLLGVI